MTTVKAGWEKRDMKTLTAREQRESGEHAQGRVLLNDIDVFLDFDPGFITKLEAQRRIIEAPKGKVLFMHDDLADSFYVIQSGWVKIFRETLDGDEVVLDILTHGHMFGETAIFDTGRYSVSAQTVENAVQYAYPCAPLKEEAERRQDSALSMLRHIARGQVHKDKEIEHRTIQNAAQRIGCFLLRICRIEKQGPIVLHLPYDKALIAGRLGMKAETFSRGLSRLQSDVGLKIQGASVEIRNQKELADYTCSACSNMFPCEDE